MALEKAYITIRLPLDAEVDMNAAFKHVQSEVQHEEVRQLVQAVQAMGGGVYESIAYGVGLIQAQTPSESYRESTSATIRHSLVSSLGTLLEEIDRLINGGGIFVDDLQSPGVMLEYDPREWFDNEPKRVGDFLSGRLFCLARTGTLQAMGFFVEGTGLEDVANYPPAP